MTSTVEDLQIVEEPDARRYVARLGGDVVGYTEYRRVGERLLFHHTVVEPAFEGRGIGGRLAAGALDDVRARGLKIRVECPFIAAWLERHPEYEELRARSG